MSVYIIQAGTDGPVKIGQSDTPRGRIPSMQAHNHEELRVIRLMPGDVGAERGFHLHYRELHIRGEWFRFCPTMLTIDPSSIAPSNFRFKRPPYKHQERRWNEFLETPANSEPITADERELLDRMRRLEARMEELERPRKRRAAGATP